MNNTYDKYSQNYNHNRFNEAENKMKRWEKRYASDRSKVVFLVRDSLLDSRSPGRCTAYTSYLETHCNICGSDQHVGKQSTSGGGFHIVCLGCAERQGE